MTKEDFYSRFGIKDNPFPLSGVTPADIPGELEFLEPIGFDKQQDNLLRDFERHIRNTQTGGYSFIADYGHGKSLILHHLIKLFREKRDTISDIKDKIIISYVRGRDLAPKFSNNELPHDILSVIIESFKTNFTTLDNSIQNEFVSILNLEFAEKAYKFNKILEENNILRIFVFIDEVEDISKFSGVIETYRDLVDIVRKISIYLFCTDTAWMRITSANPAIVKEQFGLGRIKEFYLPSFTFDIAIEAVKRMIEKVKLADSKFKNPFIPALIRTICLCSQFNGRLFCLICNLLFHNYVQQLHNNPSRLEDMPYILPEEFLSEEVLNSLEVAKEFSRIFNIELYNAIVNSLKNPNQVKLFNFFLAYYDNFTVEDIKRYLGIPDAEIYKFLFGKIDVYDSDLTVINEISILDLSPFNTESKFKNSFKSKWQYELLIKKTSKGDVATFQLLSMEDIKSIFGMGENNYSIPIKNLDDISIMINSARKGATFNRKKSEDILEFFNVKNCLQKPEQDIYRISEYLIYKIFRRETVPGTDPWVLILDDNDRNKVKSWYEANYTKKKSFEVTSEGIMQIMKRLKRIYPDNIQIQSTSKQDGYYIINEFWYVDYFFKSDLSELKLHRSRFLISYHANNIQIIKELNQHYKDKKLIPNCFILLIDDEQSTLDQFFDYLADRNFKDGTKIKDRIIFIQTTGDTAIKLFLFGLANLSNYQNNLFSKSIEFKNLENDVEQLATNLDIKIKDHLNAWKARQEKNGLFLKAVTSVDEDRFIGGLLPSLEMLITITFDEDISGIDVYSKKDFFSIEKNPYYVASDFYDRGTYINDIPKIISNLSYAHLMGLTEKEQGIYKIALSPFELYLIKSLKNFEEDLKFEDLLKIFNFESLFRETILKYYLASLAYKGIVDIFNIDMTKIEIRKKEFITENFNIIRLNNPIEIILNVKADIKRIIENFEKTRNLTCSHGVEVKKFIDPSLNQLEIRYQVLKQKNTEYYNKICKVNTEELIDTEDIFEDLIKKNLSLDTDNLEYFFQCFPILYWNNFYLKNTAEMIKTVIEDALNECSEIHDVLIELENKIDETNEIFEKNEKKIIEFVGNILNYKIQEVDGKDD